MTKGGVLADGAAVGRAPAAPPKLRRGHVDRQKKKTAAVAKPLNGFVPPDSANDRSAAAGGKLAFQQSVETADIHPAR
jgi:hypothetical protein